MMISLEWAAFIARLAPELTSLAKILFMRHRGDYIAAKNEISVIKDHWSTLADDRAKIDSELAALKAQGK